MAKRKSTSASSEPRSSAVDRPPTDGLSPGSASHTHEWLDRHLWQIQPVRDVLLGLAIVGVFLIGYKASIVTVPMLLALLLAYLFEPIINWLVVTRGWFSRQGAVSVLIAFVLFLLVVPVAFGVVLAVSQGARFIAQIATTTEDVLHVVRLGNEVRTVYPLAEFSREKSVIPGTGYRLVILGKEASIAELEASVAARVREIEGVEIEADEIEKQIDVLSEKIEQQKQEHTTLKEGSEQETSPDALKRAGRLQADEDEVGHLFAQYQEKRRQVRLLRADADSLRQRLEDAQQVGSAGSNLGTQGLDAGATPNPAGDLSKPADRRAGVSGAGADTSSVIETTDELERVFETLPGVVQSACLMVMNRGSDGDVSAADATARFGVIETALSWIKKNADAIASRAVGSGVDAAATLFRTATSIGRILFGMFLTGFFFFFISTGYPEVLRFGRSLLPDRDEHRIVDLVAKMDNVVAGFVRGRLIIAMIQSVLFSIAYAVIGVPMPIVLGVIVGFLSMIPYVALVGIPISVIGLAISAGDHEGFRAAVWWVLGAPVVVYLALQAFDDYILTPKIQGQSTGMDTPTILFASLAGGALFGVYGLLIAIPIAACVKILLREVFWPRFKAWTEGEVQDFLPIGKP